MGQIKVTKAPIEGLYVIEPTIHGDSRGYFVETYNRNDMHEAGLVVLDKVHGQAGFFHIFLIVGFHKISPVVSVDSRLNDI